MSKSWTWSSFLSSSSNLKLASTYLKTTVMTFFLSIVSFKKNILISCLLFACTCAADLNTLLFYYKHKKIVSSKHDNLLSWHNYFLLRKWFEPRSSIPWLKKIIWVIGVLRRTSQNSNHPDDLFQSRYIFYFSTNNYCHFQVGFDKNILLMSMLSPPALLQRIHSQIN